MRTSGVFAIFAVVLCSCGSDDETKPATSGGAVVNGIPTSGVEMNAFLQKKAYGAWVKESKIHTSTGPHGNLVLTFLNPELDASLKAGNAEHPVGAASVKEFYDGANKVNGWAAYVKTQAASDGGKGWYWYEVFDATPGADPASEGLGDTTCTGCHARGRDYVRIPYPLQ